MIAYFCAHCKKLLFRASLSQGSAVEIKCKCCKGMNSFKVS